MNGLTNLIKSKRAALGFSQDYMAFCLGLTQSAYCKMEREAKHRPFCTILKLLAILNISKEELYELMLKAKEVEIKK